MKKGQGNINAKNQKRARKIVYLSPEEFETIIDHSISTKQHRTELLMKFLYSSGLRIGETCGLTSEHVNFEKGEGFITRDITKSDAGVRDFCFDVELSERLKD